MKIENRVVLVSGANRGIGKAIVEELLKNDVKKVYAGARSLASLPQFNDDRVVPVELDITNANLVRNVAEKANDIDLLINNAGVATFSSILTGGIEDLHKNMNTNFFGTLEMIKAFVPVLEKSESSAIVNVATIGAFASFPIAGAYCTSKAALFSMSQAIRSELAPKEISVHTVNPGPIDTDMAKEFEGDKTSPEETAKNIIVGLRDDTADIFPDPGSQAMFAVWKKDYRELEKMVGSM